MNPPTADAVSLTGVTRRYGRGEGAVTAIADLTLRVPAGEFLTIMGPSGSGKSTLLHLVGALDRPDSGRIEIGGRDIGRLSDREAAEYRRHEVGFVFQAFNLLPRLSVLENVEMPLVLDEMAPAPRRDRARRLLEELGLGHRLAHHPPTLSGGEKQRVAIARALAAKPSLLLADEPTGNLDSHSATTVMDALVALNQDHGQTILLITHEAEVAARAGRVVRMRDGQLVDGAA